jgi:ATP-dependent RNA helicase RhlE
MSFENLGLAPALLRALADSGYTQPTPIQTEAIPLVLAGRDLLGGAQTGTGKTAAFALPMLERLFPAGVRQNRAPGRIRALVLTPTRELAAQVHDSVRTYGRHLQPTTAAVFGGMGMHPQTVALRRGMDVLVATPGRLIDHLERRNADLSGIEIVVLDEADRMLDMGFLPALKRILAALPKVRQTLMFSATFANEIKDLAQQFLRAPAEVQIAGRNSAAVTVTHRVHPVDSGRKRDLLLHILGADSRRQTLVFSRTKHGADRLARQLEEAGLKATAIHGNKSQGQRTKALRDFKQGKVVVLVATDIAARGLDIQELPVVVNYDLPMVAEDYVHRIGRTGRAGADGLALSLVAREEVSLLRGVERLLNRSLVLEPVAGFEPMGNFEGGSQVRPPQKFGNKPKPQHARRPHHGPPKPGHHAAGNKKRRPPMQWQSRGSR